MKKIQQAASAILKWLWLINDQILHGRGGGGGGLGRCYFQYILLNEIQTMFSKVLTVDLCTDHTQYVKNQGSTVLRRNKNMAVEGRTVSHYFILVIRK